MIGVTIASPRYRALAQKAQEKFEQATGLPSVLVSTPVEKNYLLKFELHTMFHGQTVVYFDADLWFLENCDLSQFDDQEEFLAVADPGAWNPDHFPLQDSKVLGIDVGKYFNSGLFIWNDRHKKVFSEGLRIYRQAERQLADFGEQSALNAAVQRLSPLRLLGHTYNYFPFCEGKNVPGFVTLQKPLGVHAAGYSPEHKLDALNYFCEKFRGRF